MAAKDLRHKVVRLYNTRVKGAAPFLTAAMKEAILADAILTVAMEADQSSPVRPYVELYTSLRHKIYEDQPL